MASSPTQRVRTACKAVADGVNFVRIERDLAPSYAVSLPLEQPTAPQLDPNRHYFGNPYDTMAFFLTLDAINFGSGYFPHLRKRPGMSGYFTVAASQRRNSHSSPRRTARGCLARSPPRNPFASSWAISPER